MNNQIIQPQSNQHAEIKLAQADFTKKFYGDLLASGLWFVGAYAARTVAISACAVTLPIAGTIGLPAAFCLLVGARTLGSRYVENMRVKGDHNDITLGEGKPYEAAIGIAFGALAYYLRSSLLFWPSVFLAVVGIGKSLMKRGEVSVDLTQVNQIENKKQYLKKFQKNKFSSEEFNAIGFNEDIIFCQATGTCLDLSTGLTFFIVKGEKKDGKDVINVCFRGLDPRKYKSFNDNYNGTKKEEVGKGWWNFSEMFSAALNFCGYLDPYRLKGSEIVAKICDHYSNLENTEIELIGDSNGGATAQFAALDNGLRATIINALPLGVGAQQYLHRQGKLTEENVQKITEVSGQHDPLSYGRMFVIPDVVIFAISGEACDGPLSGLWIAFLRIVFDSFINLFRNSPRNYRGCAYITGPVHSKLVNCHGF